MIGMGMGAFAYEEEVDGEVRSIAPPQGVTPGMHHGPFHISVRTQSSLMFLQVRAGVRDWSERFFSFLVC